MDRRDINTSETAAHKASQINKREKSITSKKLEEIDRFRKKVHEIEPAGRIPARAKHGSGGVRVASAPSPGTEPVCRDVVDAFKDTLGRCEKSRDLPGMMVSELGRDIAVMVLRNTDTELSSNLKGSILRSTDERKAQLQTLRGALETEQESIRKTIETVESINESDPYETSSIGVEFDDLRERYKTLTDLRERCEERIQQRQRTLSMTTKQAATAGLRQVSLIEFLYEELEADHPVLSTLTETVRICEKEQDNVSRHICRVM